MLARYGAPAVFLAAATAAVLLVQAGLRSPAETRPAAAHATRSALASRPVARPARSARTRFYVIRAGDTLGAVADHLGITVERLMALNPGVQPTSLHIGQKIRVPPVG